MNKVRNLNRKYSILFSPKAIAKPSVLKMQSKIEAYEITFFGRFIYKTGNKWLEDVCVKEE